MGEGSVWLAWTVVKKDFYSPKDLGSNLLISIQSRRDLHTWETAVQAGECEVNQE